MGLNYSRTISELWTKANNILVIDFSHYLNVRLKELVLGSENEVSVLRNWTSLFILTGVSPL